MIVTEVPALEGLADSSSNMEATRTSLAILVLGPCLLYFDSRDRKRENKTYLRHVTHQRAINRERGDKQQHTPREE